MSNANPYVVIVFANVFLTFGNALLGRKLGYLHMLSFLTIIWAGKLIVGGLCYGFFREQSFDQLQWHEVLGLLGVGILCGIGEGLLFVGLSKDTYLVAVIGCLYPILLTLWSWMFTGQTPSMRLLAAVVLSAVAIYLTVPTNGPPTSK